MRDPTAYFITFRCYGTWLHGDQRGSVDRNHRGVGDAYRGEEPGLESYERSLLKGQAVTLVPAMRRVVEQTIWQSCEHYGWTLAAVAVLPDHVHVVLSAHEVTPETVMNRLKAWSTRRLREAGLLAQDTKPWSRHGSTRYLWSDDDVEWAVEYVQAGQDVPWPRKRTGGWRESG